VPGRRELGQEAGPAAVLPARGETLHAAQEHEQHRRRDADRVITGHQADAEGRQRHQHDHDREHPLATDPVAEWSEEEPTERTHEERDGKHGKRAEQRRSAVGGGKELLGDVGGQKAVDREVVPLDGVADARSDDRLTE
jgi:hypothetical protein